MTEKKSKMPELSHFFLKLNPPRASFTTDMTAEERSIIGVPDPSRLDELVAADPANGLCSYEIHPMRAVTKNP